MTQTNNVFILTLAIILLGFLLKKYNYITEKEGKTISKFLMHTTFPALMIISTARVKLDASLLLIPLFCIAFCIIMIAIAWFWFAKYPNDLRGILTMGTGGLNVGLFGFPIIEGLFGKEALVYAVMFDIGNTIVTFGLVYPIGSYFSSNHKGLPEFKQLVKKIFSLPPVLGMVIGLLINISAVEMPTLFFDFLDTLAKANKSLVLLLMGIYLSFELNKKQMMAISKVLVIRYSVGLLLVVVLYFGLSHDSLLYAVLIICVILPSGLTILPFCDELNYDTRIAGTLINISLLISFVLMWGLVLGLHLN
jgi:malate permease and related proteins